MKVKLTCPCGASFEITDDHEHPKEISCPNCGLPLPDNASSDLLKMFEAFSSIKQKLVYHNNLDSINDQYKIKITHS